MVQYRKKQQQKKDKFLQIKHPLSAKLQKTSNEREIPNYKDLKLDLSLKKSLEAFGQETEETEETLTKLETPSLSYFSELVHRTMATNKKRAIIETLSFIDIALAFLAGVGYLLRAGYLQSVAIFFGAASLFLPTVILFARAIRERR